MSTLARTDGIVRGRALVSAVTMAVFSALFALSSAFPFAASRFC